MFLADFFFIKFECYVNIFKRMKFGQNSFWKLKDLKLQNTSKIYFSCILMIRESLMVSLHAKMFLSHRIFRVFKSQKIAFYNVFLCYWFNSFIVMFSFKNFKCKLPYV